MKSAAAYVPARDPLSKVRRRLTQWRPARPARLRFDEPMLSICFDDFPVSAATEGARILEAHGARGTFYAAGGLTETSGPCGRNFSAADLQRLRDAGHEIGCHTFSHDDCAQRAPFATLQDIARNRDALAELGAEPPQTLAYPYGETTGAIKAALPPRFICARGILPGLNHGRADLAQLRAYPLFGKHALVRAHAALKRAAKRKAWMIAFTHDIAAEPSPWGTASADLNALLAAAHALGVTVLPVNAAVARRQA
ncbi:MAG: polysaccharide deacetylase family protein [Hyphomonadaceae bacterium]